MSSRRRESSLQGGPGRASLGLAILLSALLSAIGCQSPGEPTAASPARAHLSLDPAIPLELRTELEGNRLLERGLALALAREFDREVELRLEKVGDGRHALRLDPGLDLASVLARDVSHLRPRVTIHFGKEAETGTRLFDAEVWAHPEEADLAPGVGMFVATLPSGVSRTHDSWLAEVRHRIRLAALPDAFLDGPTGVAAVDLQPSMTFGHQDPGASSPNRLQVVASPTLGSELDSEESAALITLVFHLDPAIHQRFAEALNSRPLGSEFFVCVNDCLVGGIRTRSRFDEEAAGPDIIPMGSGPEARDTAALLAYSIYSATGLIRLTSD